jgi:hypothetical protein
MHKEIVKVRLVGIILIMGMYRGDGIAGFNW